MWLWRVDTSCNELATYFGEEREPVSETWSWQAKREAQDKEKRVV